MNLEEMKKNFEEKLGIAPNVFDAKVKAYTEIYKKATPPKTTPAQIEKMVMSGLNSEFRAEIRSPAKHFVGMVLGSSETWDSIAETRASAIALYNDENNRARAIKEGYVNKEGIPLDNRPKMGNSEFPNRNFGKPLPEHGWTRNLFGVAYPKGGDVKAFRMVLRGDIALKEIPVFTPLNFRANISDTKSTPDTYVLNQSTTTIFSNSKEEMPPVADVLNSKWIVKYRTEIGALDAFIAGHGKNDVMITEGEVATVPPEPASTGNRMVILDDMSLVNKEQVTVWITPEHFDLINFGKGSRVAVIGTARKGSYGDPPVERIAVNAWGIYALINVDLEAAITGASELE